MASRKFKEKWIPTPLDVPHDVAVYLKVEPPLPARILPRLAAMLWYGIVIAFRGAAVLLWPSLKRGRYSLGENGRYAREFVERMGGAWVIMARLASQRTDLLGVDFCRQLAMAQDRATPLSLGVIQQVIDEELRKRGTEIDEVLSEIDERPLETRTFGQFHKARLKEGGRAVVVRVRPPGAMERAKMDLAQLSFFIGLLERVGYQPYLRWRDLLFEVKKATEDQLDSRAEETELRRIGKILRPRRIYVPLVHRRYTGERLMISECMEGVSVAHLGVALRQDRERVELWMAENDIDPRRLCRRLLNSHLELLFEHNLFYTELLPSNVFLLRGNRMALVTRNTVETLEGSVLRKYRMYYRALMERDYTKVCDTFLTMGPPLPRKDLSAMRSAVIRSLRAWETRTYIKTAPYEEKSLCAATQRVSICAGLFGLPATWTLTRLHFAERILDRSMEILNPGLNFTKALLRYDRAAQLRTITNAATKDVGKRARNLGDLLQATTHLAENFEHDADYLRGRLMSFGGTVGRAAKIGGRIALTVSRVVLAALALEVFMYIRDKDHPVQGREAGMIRRMLSALPVQGWWAWVILGGGLFCLWLLLRGLQKKLSQEEVRPVGAR